MGLLDMFKKQDINNNLYTDKEIEDYKKYITSQLGEIDCVFSEIVSDEIKLDVLIIPPTKENNYYKLVTMGMGAYKMNVPSELQKYQFERAELVIYLHPDWDIKSKEDKNYWPIRQLKTLARLPIQSNSWLGLGHTVSNDTKNSPYADNTKLCSMLLLFAFNNRYETIKEYYFRKFEKINFYQLFPIYEDELNYIFNNNWYDFIDLAGDSIVMPIDINRDSFVKKK